MSKRLVVVLVSMVLAVPASAQDGPTFSYASGFSSESGRVGLHLIAGVTLSESPTLERRVDLTVRSGEPFEGFLLANWLRDLPVGPRSAYVLGGIGTYTGSYVPVALNAGLGIRRVLDLPLFVEMRVLHAFGIDFDRDLSTVVATEHFFPSITVGTRFGGGR